MHTPPLTQVEVFIPNCVSRALSCAPPPYYFAHLPVSHFLQPHLRGRYFGAGKEFPVTAISVGRRIDVHSVFTLIPPGMQTVTMVTVGIRNQIGALFRLFSRTFADVGG